MKRLLVALSLLLMAGCGYEEGPELTERVVVELKAYQPATHGEGTGFSTSGDVTFTSIETKEQYATIFKCQHGSFVVLRKEVFEQVSVGDTLTCHYREKFWRNDDGTGNLTGYDFLNVTKEAR